MGLLDAIAALVRAGFPEETAQKIASGDLDMRLPARLERQQDLFPTTAYHGGSDDILNIDVDRASTGKTRQTGFFMSENPVIASSYAGLPSGSSDNVLPLAVNTRGFDFVDAGSSDWNRIINPDFFIGGERLATVGDLPMLYSTRSPDTPLFDLEDSIVEFDTDELARTSRQLGSPGIVIKDVADVGPNYRAMEAALEAQTGLKFGDEGYQQALDTLYGNTIVASDPSRVRSLLSAAFDPDYTGPNIMGAAAGTAALAGLLAAPEEAEAGFINRGGKTLLEAFHGSPYKFDRFSMDQIGTGEGAQAYGHGLYFADEIDVAKSYQPRDRANEEWMYEQYKAAEKAGDQYMMDAWERAMMHDSPIELRASAADPDYDEYSQSAFAEVADALAANPGTGSLSRVEIDVTPESLLDWDKPLSEQSELVQGFMNRVAERAPFDGVVRNADGTLEPDASGKMLYEWLYGQRNDPGMTLMDRQANVSRVLSENDIKGIKYLDGDSRAAGTGTSNYVIFDDGLINIAERGAADPRLLGGTALGTAGILGAIEAGQRADNAMAVAPRSETLQQINMGLRDVERRLEGSPASLLFPEGLVNYLETVNRRYEDPTMLTRAMALIDLL